MDLILKGVSCGCFDTLSFYITHSSPFSIRLLSHIGVYLSLPHFKLQLFLVCGDIAIDFFRIFVGWKMLILDRENSWISLFGTRKGVEGGLD